MSQMEPEDWELDVDRIVAALAEAMAAAEADVAERVRQGAVLLHSSDPQVAKNRATLKAALPSPEEMIAAALGTEKV